MFIRASVHACEITPTGSVLLAGYPGLRRVSTGVLDPLLVSAVHLRGGSGGIILLSLDVYALDPAIAARIRSKVSEATGTREKCVFVGATRNHSGPVCCRPMSLFNDVSCAGADMSYVDYIVDQSVKAASEAAVASRPITLAVVPFDSPGTGAVLIRSDTGRIIGAVMVAAEIPCFLGPENTGISADFLAGLRRRLAARFGGSPVVVYFPAPAADSLLTQPSAGPQLRHIEAGEAIAEGLVARARMLKGGDFVQTAEFSGEMAAIGGLPRQVPPEIVQAAAMMSEAGRREAEVFGRDGATAEERRQSRLRHWSARMAFNIASARQAGALDDSCGAVEPWRMQVVRIGEVSILGLPCLVEGNAARSIAGSVANPVWMTEYVDGDMLGGVLGMENEAAGSFELLGSFYEPEAGRKVAASAVGLLRSIRPA